MSRVGETLTYPDAPGFKVSGPSKQAADAISGTASNCRVSPMINEERGAVVDATPPAVKLPLGRPLSETRPIPRRGLSRTESAMYVGISPNKFNQLVEDGRMPKPIHLDGRRLWDLRKLDQCFDALDIDPSSDQSWADFGEGC